MVARTSDACRRVRAAGESSGARPCGELIEPITPDATEIKPLERRVDRVLKVEPSDGEGFCSPSRPRPDGLSTRGPTGPVT